jgi:hypothetical protein
MMVTSKDPETQAIADGTIPSAVKLRSLSGISPLNTGSIPPSPFPPGVDDPDTKSWSPSSTDIPPPLPPVEKDDSGSKSTGMNLDDIKNLFASAKDDLNQSKGMNVTKDQLDELKGHQAANMWTNLFMNMIAGARHTSAAPYEAPMNQKIQQEAQNLTAQQSLAQQQAKNAQEEQGFGMGQLKAGQEMAGQQFAQGPMSTGTRAAIQKMLDLSGKSDTHIPDDATEMQGQSILNDWKTPTTLQVEKDKYAQMMQNNGWKDYTDTSGMKHLFNPRTGETMTPPGQVAGSSTDNQKPLNFNDLSSGTSGLVPKQQGEALKNIPELAKDYQKNYGIPSNTFNSKLDSIYNTIDLASKGNYVAARSLPATEARVLEDLGSGRITNYDIQMQKDPTTSGIINNIHGKILGITGQGSMTPQDATYIKQAIDSLKAIHTQNMQNAQDMYKSRASGFVGRPFEDNGFLFGNQTAVPKLQQPTAVPNQSTPNLMNSNVIHADDYLKSLQK